MVSWLLLLLFAGGAGVFPGGGPDMEPGR